MWPLLKVEPYPDLNKKRTRQRRDLFICDVCNRVWQYRFGRKNIRIGCEYLEDFPRFGLDYKTCKQCRNIATTERLLSNAPSPA